MAVSIEKKERCAWVTLERPPLNVLDTALLRELDQVLNNCAEDNGTDVVVLQGAGDRAFSAGVDIRDHTRETVPEMLATVHRVIRTLFALPKVTVAVVRGLCLGGGCEMATSCDLLVASQNSTFATPEIHVGCYPPVALARFSALVGYHRAAEMILTGRRFSAQEAFQMGLVNRVYSKDRLQEGVDGILAELLSKSGAVLRVTLKGLRELSQRGFSEALQRSEEIYCNDLLNTEDVEEGVDAFLQKREPHWKHR